MCQKLRKVINVPFLQHKHISTRLHRTGSGSSRRAEQTWKVPCPLLQAARTAWPVQGSKVPFLGSCRNRKGNCICNCFLHYLSRCFLLLFCVFFWLVGWLSPIVTNRQKPKGSWHVPQPLHGLESHSKSTLFPLRYPLLAHLLATDTAGDTSFQLTDSQHSRPSPPLRAMGALAAAALRLAEFCWARLLHGEQQPGSTGSTGRIYIARGSKKSAQALHGDPREVIKRPQIQDFFLIPIPRAASHEQRKGKRRCSSTSFTPDLARCRTSAARVRSVHNQN